MDANERECKTASFCVSYLRLFAFIRGEKSFRPIVIAIFGTARLFEHPFEPVHEIEFSQVLMLHPCLFVFIRG
jgi:hypothetical protein